MNGGELLLAIVVALAGGGLAGLVTAMAARRKAPSEISVNEAEADRKDAETAHIITQAAGAAATLLKDQLDRVQAENRLIRQENGTLKCEMEVLRNENTRLMDVQQKHEQQISELRSDLRAVVEQFEQVLTGAHVLYEQVVELRVEPKYKPPERRKHAER